MTTFTLESSPTKAMDDSTNYMSNNSLNSEDSKPRKKRNRPRTSVMVHDAITKIGSAEKGASVQKIKKYIYANYNVGHKNIHYFINKYIKKAVKDGELIRSTGYLNGGAVGFFKIAAKAKPTPNDRRTQPSAEKKPQREERENTFSRETLREEPWHGRGIRWTADAVSLVMDLIEDVNVEPLSTSHFVKPYRMHYKQNDIKKIWDLICVHESVSVIIFNTDKKKLILVRQFRPAVYYGCIRPEDREKSSVNTVKYPGTKGLTLELCAGIVDKNKDLAQIAKEEVLEECGYEVPVKNFERIITYRSGVGVSGDPQTMFYVEVTNNMKVSVGGGLVSEGEMIEVVEMSIPELHIFLKQPEVNSPGGLLFALMWFLQHKAPKYSV